MNGECKRNEEECLAAEKKEVGGPDLSWRNQSALTHMPRIEGAIGMSVTDV